MLIFHTLKDLSFELFPDLKKYADNIAKNSESIVDTGLDSQNEYELAKGMNK
jgi:hypothetical protein